MSFAKRIQDHVPYGDPPIKEVRPGQYAINLCCEAAVVLVHDDCVNIDCEAHVSFTLGHGQCLIANWRATRQ